MPLLLRRAGAVLLLIAALPMTFAAGTAAFFGTAVLTSVLALLYGAGLTAAALVAVASAVGARALAGRHGSGARVRVVGVATVMTVSCAAVFVPAVSWPGPRPAAGPAPSWVRFWDLPTGSRIAYAHRPGEGTRRPYPVVFLHGGPGTPGDGLPNAAAPLAAAGFDVYAHDQLGAGRSTRLTDVTGYTVARQVADLEAIRVRTGSERLILIGQSWGASLAAQYVAAHPSRVDRAVLTGPGPIWPSAWPDGGGGDPWDRLSPAQRAQRDELLDRPRVWAQAILQGIDPRAAHALVGDDEADELLHRLAVIGKDATMCPGGTAPVHGNHQGFYVNQGTVADFATVPDPRPALRASDVPVLIMRGVCDFIPWPVAREYREVFHRSTLLTIPGAGHGIAAGRPDLYEAALTAFLTGGRLPLPAYTADAEPRP